MSVRRKQVPLIDYLDLQNCFCFCQAYTCISERFLESSYLYLSDVYRYHFDHQACFCVCHTYTDVTITLGPPELSLCLLNVYICLHYTWITRTVSMSVKCIHMSPLHLDHQNCFCVCQIYTYISITLGSPELFPCLSNIYIYLHYTWITRTVSVSVKCIHMSLLHLDHQNCFCVCHTYTYISITFGSPELFPSLSNIYIYLHYTWITRTVSVYVKCIHISPLHLDHQNCFCVCQMYTYISITLGSPELFLCLSDVYIYLHYTWITRTVSVSVRCIHMSPLHLDHQNCFCVCQTYTYVTITLRSPELFLCLSNVCICLHYTWITRTVSVSVRCIHISPLHLDHQNCFCVCQMYTYVSITLGSPELFLCLSDVYIYLHYTWITRTVSMSVRCIHMSLLHLDHQNCFCVCQMYTYISITLGSPELFLCLSDVYICHHCTWLTRTVSVYVKCIHMSPSHMDHQNCFHI